MFLLLILQFLYLVCHCSKEFSVTENNNGLVTVVVIFRHGDRTPVSPYPRDPYRNASFWPVGFGQLTNTGKRQQFKLGQWLRNRYKEFLPEKYSENDIAVFSTDVDRTLMSAEANLAGLYPPYRNQIWNSNLLWQPIPVHTIPETLDNILGMKKRCDKYSQLYNALLQSPLFVKIQKKNRDLYTYLSHSTGATVNSLEGLEYIYNTLMIEKLYNFTLPDWTTYVFPEKMKPWASLSFAVQCYTPELARLKVGPLFHGIVGHFSNATVKTKGKKILMYSAHDLTIANVLNSLNIFQYHSPPYAATILLELHRKNGSYFVNILYKNSSIPKELTLKNCQYYCPFETFKQIMAPIQLSPDKWDEECKLRLLGIVPYTDRINIIVICGLLILIIVTIVTTICLCCFKKKRQKNEYLRLPNEDV